MCGVCADRVAYYPGRHELNNGYYRLLPLFIAETIVTDLLKYFFIALTFSSIFYPIVPFDHSFDGWLYAFIIYYLGAQCFISVARILTCTLVWDESYSHRCVTRRRATGEPR